MIRLVQFRTSEGNRAVGACQDGQDGLRIVEGVDRVYDLALEAANGKISLTELISSRLGEQRVDFESLLANKLILPPIDHPDPAHCYVTGTGLTHLGSASTRDEMHRTESKQPSEDSTDSSRMFRMGLEGGKPAPGEVGVQPEWFYKGNGDGVVAPEHAFVAPQFGLDIGEEPELVGLYVIASNGTPCRVGFAIGNELSDHVTEQKNYLYLAHSKIRPCSFGPELLVGDLPADIRGTSRIIRGTETVWEAEFVTGEVNMSHTIANLEHHHFKYDTFRHPGDLHCHFLGTGTMSFADGFKTQPRDIFEIECSAFGKPLRNSLLSDTDHTKKVKQL